MLRITKYPSRIRHVKIISVKGLGQEMNNFWKVYNIKLVLSVCSLMVVIFVRCLVVEKIKIKVFACFYEILLIFKIIPKTA